MLAMKMFFVGMKRKKRGEIMNAEQYKKVVAALIDYVMYLTDTRIEKKQGEMEVLPALSQLLFSLSPVRPD